MSERGYLGYIGRQNIGVGMKALGVEDQHGKAQRKLVLSRDL